MSEKFPFVGIKSDYIIGKERELPTPIEVGVDFDTGQVKMNKNGDLLMVEGLEALKVWCYLAIHTQRFKHQVFTENYGSEHRKLIGSEYTKELTEAEAFRYIKECLLANPYIKDVKNLEVKKIGDKLDIAVEIMTDYGEIEVGGEV